MENHSYLDNNIINKLNKIVDLVCLNILTILFSIPIITIGAAYTSMHYVLLKIYRDEETSIIKMFWSSFKENFRQATYIWLVYLVYLGMLYTCSFRCLNHIFWGSKLVIIVVFIASIVTLASLSWVFVLQSRYSNKIINTIKNSLIMCITNLGNTMIMIILLLAPFLLFYKEIKMEFVIMLIGFSGTGFMQTIIYSGIFEEIEESHV